MRVVRLAIQRLGLGDVAALAGERLLEETECPPSPALSTRSNLIATLSVSPWYPTPAPAVPGIHR
jgi:hypothetical protein